MSRCAFFTADPFPLSIAFVIDQSLTSDVMAKVNNSLGAIQGALTPYDEVAIFSYNNGAQDRSGLHRRAERARSLRALHDQGHRHGDAGAGQQRPAGRLQHPPERQLRRSQPAAREIGRRQLRSCTIPKEIHTLNDAILAAAKELSTRPKGRRRIIYVISDGKEYGSKATFKEVVRYLETNKIAVYGTLVGDSARWGEGYISRFHVPFTMYDNILVKYVARHRRHAGLRSAA